MELKEVFQKPFKDLKTLAIGIVVSLIPLVNVLLLPGYFIRVAKNTMAGNQSMPEWKDWQNIVMDSLRVIAIGVVYAIPGLIFLGLAFGSALVQFLVTLGTGNVGGNVLSAALSGLGAGAGWFMLAMILFLIGGFGSTSATLMFAKTGQFSSAFKFKEIYGDFFKGEFLKAIIVVIVLSIVIGFIEAIIPAVGWLISILIGFPLGAVFYTIMADAYGK